MFYLLKERLKKLGCRRRRGMSFVEAIIMMIVSSISLWAIMSTAVWSMQTLNFSRESLASNEDIHTVYEVLESIEPSAFAGIGSDLSTVKAKMQERIGRDLSVQYTLTQVDTGSSNNGSNLVRLTIKQHGGINGAHSKRSDVVIDRDLNAYTAEAASDNKVEQ